MLPNKVLEVKPIVTDDLTLGELELLQGEDFSPKVFREFLVKYTNWTSAEIKAVKVSELKELASQLGEKLKAANIPLA